MIELYDWQKKAISAYKGSGTIEAVTGSGKSLVGKEIARKLGGSKIVCAPSLPILEQWKVILHAEPDVQYYTFQTLCKLKTSCKLLIVDEAHRSVSPEFIKLYDNVSYKYILGLTATPNDACIAKCGPVFCKVNFDEANVANFKVYFIGIDLTPFEYRQYKSLSYSIGKLIELDYKTPEDQHRLEAIILKRRRLVYSAHNRIPTALRLITDKLNEGHKVLVMCQRIDQANMISNWFKSVPIPHIVYHSGHKDDLKVYKENWVRLCISVGMLKEGFDDPDTDVGVIVSTTLSKSFNVQAIGRIIRAKPGKKAEIYILLANETTDQKVLDYSGNYNFDIKNITLSDPLELREAYYSGDKYSFCGDKIWKEVNDTRIYMKHNDIIDLLRKLKPQGGSFSVSDKGVYTKIDGKIHLVYPKFVTLNPIDTPIVEKINLDELLKE